MSNVDKDKIKRAVRDILEAIGEDPDREGLLDTPDRVARMYEEIYSGIHQDPRDHLKVIFQDEEHEELVLVRDVPFYSCCEHHLVPFFGKAHMCMTMRGVKKPGSKTITSAVRGIFEKDIAARAEAMSLITMK